MTARMWSTLQRQQWMTKLAGAGAMCAIGPGVGVAHFASPSKCDINVGQSDGDAKLRVERGHLLFGVPKKGRLFETVNQMLHGAGFEYRRENRLDIATCNNLPIKIVFLPAADIAKYVGEGDVDIGITGEDIVGESQVDVKVVMKLGFGKCNLSLQAPKGTIDDPKLLAGKRIVTSFPNLTRKFFEELEQPGEPTKIKFISGSVEAAVGLGLGDGIVDLVETGTTMRAAGLEEVAVILKSESVLIANPNMAHPELVEVVRKRLNGYLTAQAWVMVTYNCHRDNLEEAKTIAPGKRSPTVQPLEEPGWVAVACMVKKGDAAAVMDNLEAAGATDILLTKLLCTRF